MAFTVSIFSESEKWLKSINETYQKEISCSENCVDGMHVLTL